jgi:predicted ArsR family transcriptional regulator
LFYNAAMDDGGDHLDNLSSLADPVRRGIYRFVVALGTGADRNQVGAAFELSRSLAAYHLDRLADDGLLVTRFEHRGTRRGPGSGRPSKIYERATTEFGVTLPPRDYSLAAQVMVRALESLDAPGRAALTAAARSQGRQLRRSLPELSSEGDPLAIAARQLEGCGYEPYRREDCLRLRNCPFDTIARDHRDLVCSMNLALLRAMMGAGPKAPVRVELEPEDGECCVTIRGRA